MRKINIIQIFPVLNTSLTDPITKWSEPGRMSVQTMAEYNTQD